MQASLVLLLVSGFILKVEPGSEPYYLSVNKDAGHLVITEAGTDEEAGVWYVMKPKNLADPPPWKDIWYFNSQTGHIQFGEFLLTADHEGNVSLAKKPTAHSQWAFKNKITYGDSYSMRCRIVNEKAPEAHKYLAVDKTKVVKKLKAKANDGSELECDAYRVILTADENSPVWRCSATD